FAASESAAMVLNNCAEQYVSKNDVARHTGKMEVSINFEVDNTGQVVNCRLSKDSKFMEIAKRDGIYVACSSSYPSGYYTWKTNISREDSIDFQSEVSSSCWFRVYYNGKIEGVGSVPPTNFTEFYVLYDDISMIPTIDFIQSNYALKSELPEPVDLTPYYSSSQADEKFVDEDELAFELDKYETKDVADGKYALKSELPKPVDLSKYRSKNDLTYS
ncbi:hypothetical protein M9Y10_036878, partial [Tritrichomonas musculus]